MHKEIEKAVLKITQAMEKNRKAYNDAEASYRDSGYDRYFKKMQKLDADYEELKNFINAGANEELESKKKVIIEQQLQLDELKNKIKSIKSKIEYISEDLPVSAELVNLKEMLRDLVS